MKLFRFSKIPKHQQFKYVPQHFNPEKEHLEEVARSVKNMKDNSAEGMKERISGTFGRRMSREDKKAYISSLSKQRKNSNRLILLVLLVLIFFTYRFIVFTLPRIAEGLQLNMGAN